MPGAHTAERVKALRPADYREIAEQLAVPYPHRSNRRLAREFGVSGHTIKAIERAEAETIQAAKARLLRSSLRIAQAAANRVEDTISEAGCSQAAVVYGISTEKALLLAGEPTQHIAISLNPQDIYSELRQIQAHLVESASAVPALPECTPDPA